MSSDLTTPLSYISASFPSSLRFASASLHTCRRILSTPLVPPPLILLWSPATNPSAILSLRLCCILSLATAVTRARRLATLSLCAILNPAALAHRPFFATSCSPSLRYSEWPLAAAATTNKAPIGVLASDSTHLSKALEKERLRLEDRKS